MMKFYSSKATFSIVALSLLASTALAHAVSPAKLYVGGISSDMNNLGIAADTPTYRSLGGAAYYHETYILGDRNSGPSQVNGCPTTTPTVASGLTAQLKTFTTQPAPMIELGIPGVTPFSSSTVGTQQLIRCNYVAAGIKPQFGLVNISVQPDGSAATNNPHTTQIADWKTYVDTIRAIVPGIVLMPINAPNGAPNTDNLAWNDTEYDVVRQAAIYGGGLAVDTPPSQWMNPAYGNSGTVVNNPYAKWTTAAMEWAHANKLPFVMILSPYSGGQENTFLTSDTNSWVAEVTKDGQAIDSFVIENYTTDPGSPTPGATLPTIGTDSKAPSLLSTAVSLQQNYFKLTSTPTVNITLSADLTAAGVSSVPVYIIVDNVGIGAYTVTADSGKAQTQTITFTGNWPTTVAHEVGVKLTSYTGISPNGSNLRVANVSLSGVTEPGKTLTKVDWDKVEFAAH